MESATVLGEKWRNELKANLCSCFPMYKVDIMLPINFSKQHWNSLASSYRTCLFLKFNICTFSLIGQFIFFLTWNCLVRKISDGLCLFFSAFAVNSYAFSFAKYRLFHWKFQGQKSFLLSSSIKALELGHILLPSQFEDTWKIFWTAGNNSDYHLTVSQRCEYCGLFSLWLFMAYLQYNHTKSGL